MHKLTRTFWCFALIFLGGCSTLQYPWIGSQEQKKQVKAWTLSPRLVTPTLSQDLLGFRKIQRSSPVVYKDILVQANSHTGVQGYRITASGLSLIWTIPVTNGVEPSMAIINDRLFFGASDGNFYSAKAETGEVLWKVSIKAEVLSQPTLDEEGRLFFLAGNNVLFALDASDGHQLWVYSRQDTANMTVRGGGRPAVRDGIVYEGFSDGSLVALAAKSGAPQWEIQLNRNRKFRDLDASPLVEGDRLYITGYDDKLYCLSRKDGTIQWKYDIGGFEAATIDQENLYVPTSGGEVVALNKTSGKLVWKVSGLDGISTQVRLLYKDFLVFGESQGKLKILDRKTGQLTHHFQPGRGVFSTPTIDVDRKMIYFISNESHLYGLEFKEENRKWIPYVL